MPRARRALALLVLLSSLFPWLAALAATGAPRAAQGRLELSSIPSSPLALEGQWGFAWQQFVAPNWQQLPTRDFAAVPSSWNELTVGGKPEGEDGWGTYLLQVDCPAGQELAVEAVGQRTASRLFINGTEVATHGQPGPQGRSWAAVHDRVPITREFACPLRLTLHISNFDHRAGGFVRPIYVGPADVLARARERRVAFDAVLLTAYLMTGAVALIFFAVRPRERVSLAYGLFCIAMAVYSDMIGERLLLRPFGPQVSWFAYMRVEYLTWLASMALFLLTLRALFPAEIRLRVVQVVLAALGIASVAIWVLQPAVYSYLVLPGQAISVGVALYIAVAMMRADRRSRFDARVLLAGMLAVLAGLAIDLLLIDVPGPDRKFGPIGFAFFLLSPAVVIARRLSHALNAEERNRTLLENARLREDVERMSRHDLKTPLNSILGAARLLHDDPRLGGDQRELVDVLQRAGLRMVEMVNLSLGLFRMETGSYDLRPQAVDLREVASRVLVDLHTHAEAAGVAVHWQGAEAGAVFVRGEELLCYSIIANLVKNAIEASVPGQQVTVTLRAGDPVVLMVQNPTPVPAEIAARFFDKYVTARKSGGTGLGTYSARLMARAQHGNLRLDTGAEQGTTLTLTLPAVKGAALPRPRAATAAPQDPARWVRGIPSREVLLADDDEFTRLVTRRLLPAPPFHVETAANGRAAAEAMARRWPDYLLVDMEMPLQDGVETVRWVRAREEERGLPRCRVLMLSGNDDEASARRAAEAGADRFLVKPVSRERLLAAIRELEELPAEPTITVAPALAPLPPEDTVLIDPEWMEVFPEFLRLQRAAAADMLQALGSGEREQVQFLAHKSFGALAAMGLDWASRQARKVELGALQRPQQELQATLQGLADYLGRVQFAPR